jgi:hypothetical protein
MPKTPSGGSRQADLFPRSKRPTIPIEENHRLVLMTDGIDWTELLDLVEHIRESKVKNGAGRTPHLRALVGGLLLKASRDTTLREAADLIKHYAPARYLCGLTETEWSPDFRTLHDFEVQMGEDGVRILNEYTVKQAVAEKLADPSVVVGDTTAQEAAIPYPNEMRLMAAFMTSLGAASTRAGKLFKDFATKAATEFTAAAKRVREYRLFAKTKAARLKVMGELMRIIETTQRKLGGVLRRSESVGGRPAKYAKVALAKVVRLHETMGKLLPQIAYWHRTGFVAANKIVSLHMAELYSIVRGKVGKTVEFGLNWGIARLRGGFLLATVARDRRELVDAKFAIQAVDHCIGLFGKAPRAYAYDRAGHSEKNVAALKLRGVKEVGLAPRGSTAWSVSSKVREELVRERAMVEGGIGTIKSRRYGFTRSRARSARMMAYCGQRAVLGFNLNKLVRERAKRNDVGVLGH